MKLKFNLGACHIVFVVYKPEMRHLNTSQLNKHIEIDQKYIDENNSLHRKLGSIPGDILRNKHRPKKL